MQPDPYLHMQMAGPLAGSAAVYKYYRQRCQKFSQVEKIKLLSFTFLFVGKENWDTGKEK